MPIVPLSSLAKVRMGTTLRGRDATRPDPKGDYQIVQIGDLGDDGAFRRSEFTRIALNETVKDSHFLRPGDILFPNRGHRTTAAVFVGQERNVLAGAQFFVLSLESSAVLPEYLAWTLRTEDASAHFASHRKGTLVQILQRGHVEEFKLPLPSLATQRKILELDRMATHCRLLEDRLAALRSIHLEKSLLRAASGF